MTSEVQTLKGEIGPKPENRLLSATKFLFLRFGMLPFLLLIVIAVIGIAEPRFLSGANLTNVARQSTFLMIVAMAQMLVIVTAGLDLSVGSLVGLVTVTAGLVMNAQIGGGADPGMAITIGIIAGLGVSLCVGLINGICIAYLGLNPFITTLATLTALVGVSLTLSGGIPVGGLPNEFSQVFSFNAFMGVQAPIIATLVVFAAGYFLFHHTVLGRYFYAIGSNPRAAHLSGIPARPVRLAAYVLCSVVTSIAGLLLLARTGSGGANIGADFALQSVAACVIAGVSLFGGAGRIGNVVLGALFLTLLSNGMNVLQVQSYSQKIVVGAILIIALVGDQLRMRLLGQRKTT